MNRNQTVNRNRLVPAACALALLAGTPLRAQSLGPNGLAGASLEDMMNIDVTSVSKKEQTLSRTGAAVFVISQEDIRRSGATNIPDVLRIAPGVEVAQVNSNQWAISIRGFNTLYSNKLLVLIDGRTVYTDSFSGVYWDQVDVPLEDIERIEVIRGPGGTVWGANAVNGVINIITKSAADTKGGVVTAGAGTRQSGQGLAQYGADAGSKGAYRFFGKYFNNENSPLPGGVHAADGWHTWHAGFRSDWAPFRNDTVSVQGDFLNGDGGATTQIVSGSPPEAAALNNRLTNRSGDVLAHWDHELAGGSTASLQLYDNVISRREAGVNISDNTLDAELEHHIAAGTRHDIVWGLDYRFTRSDLRPAASYGLQVNPALRQENLFALFAQDEIRLSGSVFLTVGSKVEHNVYTGFEYAPSTQLVWKRSARDTFWASAARAIREPNSLEHGISYNLGVEPVPGAGQALILLTGNPRLEAERLNDFEGGYRAQVRSGLSVDLTGFLSYYHRLSTNEPRTPYVAFGSDGPMIVAPLTYGNLAHARDFGLEAFANWQVTGRWKLSPGFSLLRMRLGNDPGGLDPTTANLAGYSPSRQFEMRSALDLRRHLEWDVSVKYTGALNTPAIPAYARVDTRLGWHLGESLEFSLTGQNLASARHFEFFDNSGLFTASLVARSASARLTWRF